MADQVDIHKMTQSEDVKEKIKAVDLLYKNFANLSNKKQAWDDLIRLTMDKDSDIRCRAVFDIDLVFSHVPDKKQAWDDLIQLTRGKFFIVQWRTIIALGSVFSYISDKNKAWADLHHLLHDKDCDTRRYATEALSSAFSQIPDKNQAFAIIHHLTHDDDSNLRQCTAKVLGQTFSLAPDKNQAWDDLIRLAQEDKPRIRASANYSLGRASIFKATEAEVEEDFRNELENALEFFENSSHDLTSSNPAKFCLPFYRSFYAITFKKKEAQSEVQEYLAEAKKAVKGSKSKEKLIEAVENLSNALNEAQKVQDMDLIAMKYDLNTYMQYCERAADILDATENEAPGATRLIRKGLPIIDERIKSIIAGIQHNAKAIFKETKDTPLKEFGLKTCKQAQKLSLQDPLTLGIGLGRMIDTARSWCEYIKQTDKKRSACEKLNSLRNLELVDQVIVFADIFEYISKNLDLPRIQTVCISQTLKEVVRVAAIQLGYELTKSFPPVIKHKEIVKTKIFSSLDLAKQYNTDIVCLPELSLCEDWITEIKNKYLDMIVIGGGFYKDSKNVCPVIIKSDIDIPMQSKLMPSAFEDPEMWGTGMISGDRIYKYETQFGRFVILICRDFESLVHYFRDDDVDFIFCPAFNQANDRFHQEANNHVTKTPSYILIANTGIYGGTSIFAQLNKNYFDRLVGDGCKDEDDLSFKLCEAKKGKDEVVIADFDLIHKTIQIPTPSESYKERRSVIRIKKLPIP